MILVPSRFNTVSRVVHLLGQYLLGGLLKLDAIPMASDPVRKQITVIILVGPRCCYGQVD